MKRNFATSAKMHEIPRSSANFVCTLLAEYYASVENDCYWDAAAKSTKLVVVETQVDHNKIYPNFILFILFYIL